MASPALTQGTQRIREAATLAQVVAQYVHLRPAGANRLAGLCPFHNEKTASFHVATDKNLWICRGCGTGGDVFSFVSRIEGIPFIKARTLLAEQYGILLDERPLTRQEQAAQRRQRVYAERLAEETAWYWQHVRRRYQFRFDLLMAVAVMASDRGDEETYQHYARRAWRWGSILRRLDGMAPAALLRAYTRVRSRRDVVVTVEAARVTVRSESDTWGRIMRAVRPEQLDGVVGRMAERVA